MQFSHTTKFNDWINSINLYSPSSLCILTSHSIACHIALNWPAATSEILVKESCSDKSTLYCSLVHGSEWGNSTFFGGTALGDLIIWQTGNFILHRLSGHNVSIYLQIFLIIVKYYYF